ncbi:MAG: PDK repeat-containing protein [Bacteroidetes bacterium]|nr:MAG: PDK repeat-containing protein [Bacteroidota bacterium]
MIRSLFSAALLFNGIACVSAQSYSVLFIGNSYTYVNNLPQVLQSLAQADGKNITFDSSTPGGYTLQMHTQDANTISKIYQQPWDYVVIQAQSQEPSFSPAQVASQTFPYAAMLDSMIKDNDSCTQTLFYMTWGRKNGDASNCASYPPVCTYAGMQQRLRDSYVQMGQDNGAMVGPVGIAWKNIIATNPAFDLYQADESHPSTWGTYAAACVFYSSVFRESTVGIPYYFSIPQADAQLIQGIASSVVLDSMSTWNTEIYHPHPAYTATGSGNSVTLTSTSTNNSSVNWDFGAQGNSAQPVFSHTFPAAGAYPFTLIASNNCLSDTLYDTLLVPLFTGVPELYPGRGFDISPNPSAGIFRVHVPVPAAYDWQLFDLRGLPVACGANKTARETSIDLSEIPAGTYLLRLKGEQLVQTKKIVISR